MVPPCHAGIVTGKVSQEDTTHSSYILFPYSALVSTPKCHPDDHHSSQEVVLCSPYSLPALCGTHCFIPVKHVAMWCRSDLPSCQAALIRSFLLAQSQKSRAFLT